MRRALLLLLLKMWYECGTHSIETKTTVDNSNWADKLKMRGRDTQAQTTHTRRVGATAGRKKCDARRAYRSSTTKSPAHWFDKFPCAGNELNRDKTKDHPVENKTKETNEEKNPATRHYLPKSFLFCSLSLSVFECVCCVSVATFYCFHSFLRRSLCWVEAVDYSLVYIQRLTREARNYLWWLRNCMLFLFFIYISFFARMPS